MTELRLVPTDPEPVDVDGPDDGTLGGLFASLCQEMRRVLRGGRGIATEAALGGVLLHLEALAEDYARTEMPTPTEKRMA